MSKTRILIIEDESAIAEDVVFLHTGRIVELS